MLNHENYNVCYKIENHNLDLIRLFLKIFAGTFYLYISRFSFYPDIMFPIYRNKLTICTGCSILSHHQKHFCLNQKLLYI